MATQSFAKLCWTVALFFTSRLQPPNVQALLTCLALIYAAGTPSASTYVRGGGRNNLTLALNVPQNNTDNLFFHFNGPASASWIGFGFGSQMQNSLMFVAYASQDGKNVTISPRLGTGHVEPQHTTDVTVSTFAGTGLQDGVYTINAMCSGCRKWNGGELDITDQRSPMIYALGPAWGLESNELDAPIRQHQINGGFSLNLVKATGIGGVPSFAAAIAVGGSDGDGNDDGDDDGDNFFYSPGVGAHALLMIVSFLIIFPGGYLFLRVFEKVWLHYSIQSVGALFVLLGSAVGIAVSKKDNLVSILTPLTPTPY